MTDRTGAVFDLGYQPYEGQRLGRRGAVNAVVRDGLRRVLGLRRRARAKALPWLLIGIALLPAAFFLAFSVLTGDLVDQEVDLFGAAEYFSFNATINLLFIALAASELLVPDRLYGVLSVYASRPLLMIDYLAARATSLAILVLTFLFVPGVLLLIGDATVAREGFVEHITDNLDVLWQSFAASVVYFVAFAPLAFVVAAVANKIAYAAGIYLGFMFISSGVTEGLVDSGFDLFALGAFNHHPRYLSDWIFDESTHRWIPERAGFDPWVSLLVIVVVAAVCAWFLERRYRRMG